MVTSQEAKGYLNWRLSSEDMLAGSVTYCTSFTTDSGRFRNSMRRPFRALHSCDGAPDRDQNNRKPITQHSIEYSSQCRCVAEGESTEIAPQTILVHFLIQARHQGCRVVQQRLCGSITSTLISYCLCTLWDGNARPKGLPLQWGISCKSSSILTGANYSSRYRLEVNNPDSQ